MIKIQLHSSFQKNRPLLLEHNTSQDTNSTMLGWKTLSRGLWKLVVILPFMHFFFFLSCIHFVVPLFSSFISHVVILRLKFSLLVTLLLLFVWGNKCLFSRRSAYFNLTAQFSSVFVLTVNFVCSSLWKCTTLKWAKPSRNGICF